MIVLTVSIVFVLTLLVCVAAYVKDQALTRYATYRGDPVAKPEAPVAPEGPEGEIHRVDPKFAS